MADAVHAAATRFASDLADAFIDDLAPHLTCHEAETVADLYRALGHDEMGDSIVHAHAESDTEDDDQHHDVYLLDWQEGDISGSRRERQSAEEPNQWGS